MLLIGDIGVGSKPDQPQENGDVGVGSKPTQPEESMRVYDE
jgi:hypothetical protein